MWETCFKYIPDKITVVVKDSSKEKGVSLPTVCFFALLGKGSDRTIAFWTTVPGQMCPGIGHSFPLASVSQYCHKALPLMPMSWDVNDQDGIGQDTII